MDRALALLLLTAGLNAVVVVRSFLSKSEKLSLLLLQLLLVCVGVGAALTHAVAVAVGNGDGVDVAGAGRSLLTCAAGALLVVIAGPPVAGAPRLVRHSVAIFVGLMSLGLFTEVVIVARVLGGAVAVAVSAVAAAVVAVAVGLCVLAWRRAGDAESALARARLRTDTVAAAMLGLSAIVAATSAWAGANGHLWAAVLAVSAALATAARAAAAPQDRRDAVVVALAAVVVGVVVGGDGDVNAYVTVVCGVAVATLLGRALLAAPRTHARHAAPPPPATEPVGLFGIVPVVDDAGVRRPARPRVLSRTPARRLLDAALERAHRAQPGPRGRAVVDIVGVEDADIDGDPSEIAEALSAVLDSALRHQARHPWSKVHVVVRAAVQTVSFEVNDSAPSEGDGEGPLFGEGGGDALALARARALTERHGGELFARRGPEGSSVQLTLPRRTTRPVASA